MLNVDSEEEKSDPRDWIVVEHQLGASSLHEEFVTYTASLDSKLCLLISYDKRRSDYGREYSSL